MTSLPLLQYKTPPKKQKNKQICLLSPGNLSLEKSKRKKLCDWLPDQGWEDIVRLMELFPNEFGTLADDIEKNPEEWKEVSGENH